MNESLESAVPEAITRAATGLRALEHVPAAHVDLFERLSQAQWKARGGLRGPVYPPLAAETAAKMLRHGFYLLDFARLQLDPAVLLPLWEELCAIMVERGELKAAQAERLRRALSEEKLPLAELAGVVLRGEQEALAALAKRVRVSGRLLAWLTTLMLKPVVGAAAQEVEAHLRGLSWPHAYCPVCGHEPLMAVTLRDGRREMECSLCATRWDVRRGRCPFCGNDDKQTYRFLYYDLESPYRVDVCDKCRRYVKVADERKMQADAPTVLPADDIATLYLDELARRKRYLPPWSGAPGGKRKSQRQSEEEVVPGPE